MLPAQQPDRVGDVIAGQQAEHNQRQRAARKARIARIELAAGQRDLHDAIGDARHEQQRNAFPDRSLYLRLLAIKQNRLAWGLAFSPDRQALDAKQAVELARKATEIAPGEGLFWNTLGAAYFRAGNWQECIKTLQKSMQLRKGGDGFDWLFLAMASHHLGMPNEANQWLNKAVQWITLIEQGKYPSPLLEIQWQSQRRQVEMLRQEAERLIRSKPEERR